MFTLQVFAPAMGIKSPSPFSMKAIALMQMSGFAYQLKHGDPRKAPKSKLPVLIDGDKIIPDSTHILEYLTTAHGFSPDNDLTKQQLAIAEAFRRMIEEHLYWVLVYSRWIDNGAAVRESYFAAVPALMRKFVFRIVVKQVKSALHGQGMGRHSAAEVYAFGTEDLAAIADFLGDKDYFFGDEPTSIDASLYGILGNILVPPLETPLKKAAQSHANLLAYHQRFEKRFDMAEG